MADNLDKLYNCNYSNSKGSQPESVSLQLLWLSVVLPFHLIRPQQTTGPFTNKVLNTLFALILTRLLQLKSPLFGIICLYILLYIIFVVNLFLSNYNYVDRLNLFLFLYIIHIFLD